MRIAVLLLMLCFAFSSSASDFNWKGKGDSFTRQTAGIYLWWNLGLRLPAGEYQVKAKIRRTAPGTFTMQAVDASSGKSFWTKGVPVLSEYSELDFGSFVYDGTFMLRLSDWNEAGFFIESVSLTQLRLLDVPETPSVSCDSLNGWISLGETSISIDEQSKKEGKGALKVTVEPKEKRKWFDAGVLRAMPVNKASIVSFWIKFETEPLPFWVQIFTSEKGVAQKLDPTALGIRKGEWKFIELPVSTFMFKPQRSTVEKLRALQFSPDEVLNSPQIFLLDDILLEP